MQKKTAREKTKPRHTHELYDLQREKASVTWEKYSQIKSGQRTNEK